MTTKGKIGKIGDILSMAIAMGGGIPDIKIPSKKGISQDKATPPRSMTDEEKEYYAIHKNLNNFKPKN